MLGRVRLGATAGAYPAACPRALRYPRFQSRRAPPDDSDDDGGDYDDYENEYYRPRQEYD